MREINAIGKASASDSDIVSSSSYSCKHDLAFLCKHAFSGNDDHLNFRRVIRCKNCGKCRLLSGGLLVFVANSDFSVTDLDGSDQSTNHVSPSSS